MQIYVNVKARCDGDGTKERPFKRINDAARIAVPGDEVLVMPGVYREYVNPWRNQRKQDCLPVGRASGSSHQWRGRGERLGTVFRKCLGDANPEWGI